MIHVIATITVAPGRRQDFIAEFWRVVPLVQAEPGCLAYGPAVDIATGIATQIPQRPEVVTVIEQWADVASLHAHLVAPHMGAYRERVKGLVSSVAIQVMKPC